jgi:hypothetical protein
MPSTTGIELGPDSCVLVSAAAAQGAVDVRAVHIIGPAVWPAEESALVALLRDARRQFSLPRNARVILWGAPDTASIDQAVAKVATGPLRAAGFQVDSVLSPPEALALLAASRPRASAEPGVVWLALNTHGASIAIVTGRELLFARTFPWSYDARPMTPKAQLLQRYSLISHLAPEVRRGLADVRASHGITVEAAVTCGDLPDLRSLTMPLIEELDLEVETLDSLDGLRLVGKAKAARLGDAAPGIRLACAAAASGPQAAGGGMNSPLRVGAAAGVIVALVGVGYVFSQRASGRPANVESNAPGQPRPTAAPPSGATVAGGTGNHSAQTSPTHAAAPALPAAPSSGSGATELVPPPAAHAAKGPTPAPPAPAGLRPPARQSAASPAVRPAAPAPKSPPSASVAVDARRATKPVAKASTTPAPADPRTRRTSIDPMWLPQSGTPQPPPAPRIRLKEPLPKIDSILIDQDRRLAVIGGRPVAVGEPVGPRVLLRIEQEAIILGEPSGLSVRVELRPRPGR